MKMSSSKICATKVFLALIDLDKPSRALDVTDYLAGETGADSRRIATAVRRQLDQLVRKGFIDRKENLYILIKDENMIRERLKVIEAREKAKPFAKCKRSTSSISTANAAESCISIAGCMSIAAIPRQIRRENPVLRTTMSEAEIKYTQRFWKEPLL